MKALALDANILIRAVLGVHVRDLLFAYADTVRFCAPDVAWADAHRHLLTLLPKRGSDLAKGLARLEQLQAIVEFVEARFYETAKADALPRIERRDPDDWPVLACALLLDCPVWTQDVDFFGTGVATWTSDRVEFYLTAASQG
ncbi:MAG: PIN domain-containing protein [Desulfovibrionaceae bacterium]|jgi:predicted nucleic acid-binding protein|nr:PIN domain-containing protein [Desulfovibrionaceae bacterium]